MFQAGVHRNTRFVHCLIIGFVSVGIALLLWISGWTEGIESKTWDWRVRILAKPGKATNDICLISINQYSLDWGEKRHEFSWPWPRSIYGYLLSFCKRAGVKAVAMDILFTEASDRDKIDQDIALGEALKDTDTAGALLLSDKPGDENKWPADFPKPPYTITPPISTLNKTDMASLFLKSAAFPAPEIGPNIKILANVYQNPDSDGIYRRAHPLVFFDGIPVLSLGIGAYAASQENVKLQLTPTDLQIDGRRIPISSIGECILRFRGPSGTHKNFTAAAVIESELLMEEGQPPLINLNQLKDKYVLLGVTAAGLFDLRSVPISGVYPGVEIQATILDNFLSEDFMQMAPTWLSIGFIILITFSCTLILTLVHSPAKSIPIASLFIVLPISTAIFAYQLGYWLPLVVTEIAILESIILVLVVNFATEGIQKQYIKNAFQQYLNPKVIEEILKHPDKLKLGGVKRTLSIFFSDLQGFTTISEALAPEALTQLINDYLTAMTDIIQEEGGTVDKYEGDAIIAFWNAPLEVPDHAIRAVTAALRCQEKLAELRPFFRTQIGKDLFMRVGINTGDAIVGNMGSNTRFDYTMLGDAVNLAARLEGTNKQFGTFTMISEATLKLTADQFQARELAKVAVVGKKEAVTVYEPMQQSEYTLKAEILHSFENGLARFYEGHFEQARAIFARNAETDPPSAAYLKKCDEMLDTKPENWQGVWVMTSK